MYKKKGVTLVELMIVMLILAILMVAMTSALNPANLINKGKDATRKKDLKRIKIAFEEYYNDKGCFPSQATIDELNSAPCGSVGLYQLNPWPCEPGGGRYTVKVDATSACPDWFAALTILRATSDKDMIKVEGKKYNYCVSSTNVTCMDYNDDEEVMGASSEEPIATPTPIVCEPKIGGCFTFQDGRCNTDTRGCFAPNCYSNGSCTVSVCACN